MSYYNYTKVRKMDTKIYNIGNYKIPGGISTQFLVLLSVNEILFNIVGIFISKHFGIPYLDIKNNNYILGCVFLIFPFILSFLESLIKVHQYSFPQYILNIIIIYLEPKNKSLKECGSNVKSHKNFKIEDLLD